MKDKTLNSDSTLFDEFQYIQNISDKIASPDRKKALIADAIRRHLPIGAVNNLLSAVLRAETSFTEEAKSTIDDHWRHSLFMRSWDLRMAVRQLENRLQAYIQVPGCLRQTYLTSFYQKVASGIVGMVLLSGLFKLLTSNYRGSLQGMLTTLLAGLVVCPAVALLDEIFRIYLPQRRALKEFEQDLRALDSICHGRWMEYFKTENLIQQIEEAPTPSEAVAED